MMSGPLTTTVELKKAIQITYGARFEWPLRSDRVIATKVMSGEGQRWSVATRHCLRELPCNNLLRLLRKYDEILDIVHSCNAKLPTTVTSHWIQTLAIKRFHDRCSCLENETVLQ